MPHSCQRAQSDWRLCVKAKAGLNPREEGAKPDNSHSRAEMAFYHTRGEERGGNSGEQFSRRQTNEKPLN